MRGSPQQATLRWVMLDGEPRHVDEFYGIPPGCRPRVTCLACKQELILKLGTKVVRHAAHAPDSTCALRNPESVVHLNAKLHLAAQLRAGKSVLVERRCKATADRTCEARRVGVWLEGWDQVEVEYEVEARRPDVVLLRGGSWLGAIEVLVSNPVSAEKRRDLRKAGVDWIEIAGSAEFYGPDGWKLTTPLNVVDAARSWECGPCETLRGEFATIEKQRREELSRLRRARKSLAAHLRDLLHGVVREGQVVKAFQIVDLYYDNGNQYREHFLVVEERSVGNRTRGAIVGRRESERAIARFEDIGEGLRPAIVRKTIEDYLRRFPATVDVLIDWTRLSPPDAIRDSDLLSLIEDGLVAETWRATDPRSVHLRLVRWLLEQAAAYHEVGPRKYWHRARGRWFIGGSEALRGGIAEVAQRIVDPALRSRVRRLRLR